MTPHGRRCCRRLNKLREFQFQVSPFIPVSACQAGHNEFFVRYDDDCHTDLTSPARHAAREGGLHLRAAVRFA